MKKLSLINRLLCFIVSLVIFSSPIFLSGCTLFDFGSGNSSDSAQSPSNPSAGGSVPGGSGGNPSDGDDSASSSTIYDPPKENELSFNDYNDYYQNYRITYVPGEGASRDSFNKSLETQNEQVAISLLTELYNEYGIADDGASPKYEQEELSIVEIDGKYLTYKDLNTTNYYFVRLNSEEKKQFTHSNAINDNQTNDYAEYITWLWNTYSAQDDLTEEKNAKKDAFISNVFQAKLTLAAYVILSGETLNEDGTGSFVDKYKSYFENNDVSKSIKANYLDEGSLNLSSFEELLSNIDHLGFTENEQNSLRNFVFNYVIGKDLMQTDNQRFVNAYYDGSNVQIVYHYGDRNSAYNKFLTDETYATVSYDGSISFDFTDSKSEEGLVYYAAEYLNLGSKKSDFAPQGLYLNGYSASNVFNANNSSPADVTEGVYNALIGTYGTKVKTDANGNIMKDNNGNTLCDFNANVWAYDSNLNENSSNATNTVEYKFGGNTYSLFSLRLPYFKNYYNTVSFIIRDMFGELTVQKKSELDAEWQTEHAMDYPYETEFPTVPYSYFSDYNNTDMIFDNKSFAHMYSGYKAYQNVVIMPKEDVYIKTGAFFISRELVENETFGSGAGDFELTIYARYYDADSQKYATWGDDNSEFYFIKTVRVTCQAVYDSLGNFQDYVPVVIDFDVREIITTAQINGSEKDSYMLNAFPEDEEIKEHEEILISKENYGYWFTQIDTPLGDSVVCYDGKANGSQSYLEFIFANPDGRAFQFCFHPALCYKAN